MGFAVEVEVVCDLERRIDAGVICKHHPATPCIPTPAKLSTSTLLAATRHL